MPSEGTEALRRRQLTGLFHEACSHTNHSDCHREPRGNCCKPTTLVLMTPNDRVERPATMTVPRTDAAH